MYAIWFVFEKKDTEYFSDIILELSSEYNSHFFEPHITAYGLIDIDFDVLDKIMINIIQGEKQFTVEKKIVSYSDDFWKTLFVEFYTNESLERINKKLTDSLNSSLKYEFKPHASLIYKKMNQDEQKKLADTIIIKENFKVVGICIQKFSEDIEKWKIIHKYDLAVK